MATPTPVKASDALDDLVDQFSDPLSFFRELIQNSLDAGSAEVEVRVEYEAGKGRDGAMVIHVDDWGDGMDRKIIDRRLTRLFSSAKDGDMTKIGKFGIGFVSVFAIQPDAVVVDTSRGGEHWRIIFDENRDFTRIVRDHPVDGTKVRIYKTATPAEYREFVARAEKTIRYWCKHTRGEVRFQGEIINEPFDLGLPCRVARDDGFSKIIVAHPHEARSFFGFYNQGLTLVEGDRGHVDGIAFKVSSPHLEHTLTRDNVIQDKAFHRVMDEVRRLATDDLCRVVFERLEGYEAGPGDVAEREYLWAALLWHLRGGHVLPAGVEKRKIFPRFGGEPASLADCRAQLRRPFRDKRLLWASAPSPLTAGLAQRGELVLDIPETSLVVQALQVVAQEGTAADDPSRFSRVVRADHLFCRPSLPETKRPRWSRLGTALAGLLEAHGARISGVHFAHFKYRGSSIAKRVAITQSNAGEVSELAECTELGTSLFSSRRAVVINADHGTVEVLVELAVREPELAALQLAKLFFLGDKLDHELDTEMASIAAEQRWQRSSS